jgi:hypothetical protein
MAVDCFEESAMKKEFFKESESLVAQQLPRTELDDVPSASRDPTPP